MKSTVAILALLAGVGILPLSAHAGYEVLWSFQMQNGDPSDVFFGQRLTVQNLVGDIDGDGALEIVGLSLNYGLLRVLDSSSGYIELSLQSSLGTWRDPALFDVNGDGRPEILAREDNGLGMGRLVAVGFMGVAGVSEENKAPGVSVVRVTPIPSGGPVAFNLDVTQRCHVRLRMFDLSGRLLKVTSDQLCEPGVAVISWDGTTSEGRPAVSGVYFYRIEADGALVKADKIVVTR